MEYELNDVGTCRKKVILKFTAQDIDAAFDQSYKEINNYVQIKGFRKGKAPRIALEKRYAEEAASDVKRELANKHLGAVIKESKLNVLGEIAETDSNGTPKPKNDFTMAFEVDFVPHFDVPEYKGLELTEQPLDVSEEKVTEALVRYQKIFANYAPVDEASKEEDILVVDFTVLAGDEEIAAMKEQRLRIEGTVLFGLPCPDLVAKFTGVSKDQTVDLTLTLPNDHPRADLRGKEAKVIVNVKSVERGDLPELDDAFAANLGMGSIAAFRDRIRGNLAREAMLAARAKQEDEIIDKILGAVQFDIPQRVVDSEAAALEEQQHQRLHQVNMPEEEIHAKVEAYKPEARRLAERKVRWGVISAEISEKENITVSNEDMAQQIEALARNYNTSPAKIMQRIRQFDGAGAMMNEILQIKVMQFILDNAKGGRLDPARKDADTDQVNAAAAGSVTEPQNA